MLYIGVFILTLLIGIGSDASLAWYDSEPPNEKCRS